MITVDDKKIKINHYFSLAKQYHSLKEYRKAWESWVCAHGLNDGNYQVEISNKIVDNLINLNIIPHNLPDKGNDLIFIVGMPRSGTTLLEQILCTHKDIQGYGERREFVTIMDYFYSRQFKYTLEDIMTCQQIYRTGLTSSKKIIYHVDKMPRNFLAIPLIQLIFPNAKIIQTNRNRFCNCMSIYSSNFSEFTPYAHRWETLNIFYDQYLKITNHFKPFKVNYEELVENFDGTIERIMDYLNIIPNNKEQEFYKNKNIVITCSKDQVKKPLYKNSNSSWFPYRSIVFGENNL